MTDISIEAPGDNDGVRLVSFDQRFSQVAAAPEPGSLALLGLGLAALGLRRRG